uniref:Uncharacterized protein n=1 Tax=Panagrolaimus sp. PS1159 TaxID=55785 RepID=A0AC35FZZ9_9BILA
MERKKAERMETKSMKMKKQAEAARIRYHKLNFDEKKALNQKTALRQKRQRHRRKEMEELESILRQTNDIYFGDGPEKMEEQNCEEIKPCQCSMKDEKEEMLADQKVPDQKDVVRIQDFKYDPVKDKNKQYLSRKALAARQRYHRMTPEQKQQYNQLRAERTRLRRQEEDKLLSTPISHITDELLERVKEIAFRNAKRNESARMRYQRMTPAERKEYNKKRMNYYKKGSKNNEE